MAYENPYVNGRAAQELTNELNQLNVLLAHNHAVMKLGEDNTITKENVKNHIEILKKSINLQQGLNGYTSSTLFEKGRRSLATAYMDIRNLKSRYGISD